MLWTALVLGLLGSFHCIGMCGPIAFVLPINRKSKPIAAFQTFLYHFGRIVTYSFIGLLFGIIGKGLYLSGFQQRLSIVVGVLMIVLIVFPLVFKTIKNPSRPLISIIGKVKSNLGYFLKKKSNSAIFFIGFFNGFLPCGLVYMAIIGSIAAGNYVDGALYMAMFGLGTVPMMTGAIFVGNFITIKVRQKIQKAIPILVIVIGLLFILRGLGLGIPYISPSDANLQLSNNPGHCVTVEVN
ncbi:sulfite exporter TauE/SafE family protein [Lutibacter sp.]|uniref:sulfite exporter TauE/SafE family protein n=1 Tax=Lutibacter sp. TaxID=1925666 RepID=UPI0027342FDA|nr:sulfite exporter TauE/SafE family protein [Lutibacter sp.]MDP3313562.1 sulfite exporter TauE/SafE family protein [Lutibacter sp.]